MKKMFLVYLLMILLGAALVVCNAGEEAQAGQIRETFLNPSALDTINWLPKEVPTRRVRYADDSLTFGDLRLPDKSNLKSSTGAYPVIVMVHGGAWTASYSLDYVAPLTEALTDLGIATWSIEYRRIGNPGGTYPGIFLDVAAATDYLRVLAPEHNLDLNRVIVVGHSSGGHLALWISGRAKIPPSSPLYVASPLPIKAVVSLAGIPNLKDALERGDRKDVLTLLGGISPEEAIPLYNETSIYQMIPTGVPTSHIVGTLDNPWRIAITEEFVEQANKLGDISRITVPLGANHFDVVDPNAPAWPIIEKEVLWALGENVPNSN